MITEPDAAVPPLLAAVKKLKPVAPSVEATGKPASPPPLAELDKATVIQVPMIATAMKEALGDSKVSLIRTPTSWTSNLWSFEHPLDSIGHDGGAGIGSGPGICVGAALALRGSGRLPMAVLGDGDFMMGATAIWTAAHYEIPLLLVIANNRSYFNDELHQDRVARERGRPPENRWIGQAIREPDIDIAGVARAQGCAGVGPVEDPKKLVAAIKEAVAAVRAGKTAVVDVRVSTGYDAATSAAILKRHRG
jgi:thiamine pyrophosphate-dependent acetolactate synthase large subunit-like protein